MTRQCGLLPFLQYASAVFIVAVPLNYLWELGQRPLYVGMADDPTAWWHCFVASLGDGALVCLIYAVGCFAFRQRDWFARQNLARTAFIVIAGFIVGLAVERLGAQVMHRWTYTATMPLIPGLEVGLVPVVQMMLLPQLIFGIVWGLRLPR